MPEDSIPIMEDELNEGYNSSKTEKQWIKFMETTNNAKIQPQYRIGKHVVDGFDEKNIYMFYGCYWHGCRECFPPGHNFVQKMPYYAY